MKKFKLFSYVTIAILCISSSLHSPMIVDYIGFMYGVLFYIGVVFLTLMSFRKLTNLTKNFDISSNMMMYLIMYALEIETCLIGLLFDINI
jgi:hypothetical protein